MSNSFYLFFFAFFLLLPLSCFPCVSEATLFSCVIPSVDDEDDDEDVEAVAVVCVVSVADALVLRDLFSSSRFASMSALLARPKKLSCWDEDWSVI